MSQGYKKFLFLWSASLISSTGSGMTAFALGIFIYQKTGLSTMTGLMILAGFLPNLLLSPLAGIMADRYDRRLLMMIGDGFSIVGLVCILISLNFLKASLLIGAIMLGTAISSAFSSLVEPSFRSTISDLLKEEEYTKASGMVQLIPAARYLLSPVLAGIVLSLSGIFVVILFDILTILVTLPITYMVRKEMRGVHNGVPSKLRADLVLGYHLIHDKKGLWLLVLLGILVSFCLGTVQTLMIPMLLAFGNASFVGFVTTISACGMLVGGLFWSRVSLKKDLTRVLERALLAMGIFMMLFALGENEISVCFFGFCLFLTLPFANTAMDYLVRITVPSEHQGKVWGLIGLISQGGYIVSYAFMGIFVDYFIMPFLQRESSFQYVLFFLIGKGEERAPALAIFLSGFFLILIALFLPQKDEIRALEEKDVLDII